MDAGTFRISFQVVVDTMLYFIIPFKLLDDRPSYCLGSEVRAGTFNAVQIIKRNHLKHNQNNEVDIHVLDDSKYFQDRPI